MAGGPVTEHRAAPLEVRGRTIAGLAVPWGDRASVVVAGERVDETFTRGAFGKGGNLRPVPLVVEHGGPRIGALTPSSTERGLEVRGQYSGDLGGRNRFSVEFRARGETRSGGLRIVHDADLHAVAAVASPAYSGAVIEARRKLGGYGTRIFYGNEADCSCAGADCDTVSVGVDGFEALRLMQEGAIRDGTDLATRLRTIQGITAEALERIRNSPVHRAGGRSVPQVSAIARGAGDVVADTVTNSLRFEFRKDGMHIVVDPLDTEAGRRIRELIGAGVAVHARPVIDFKRSAFVKDGRAARFSLAWFDYVLVKPTNRTRGVDPLKALLNRPVSRRRKHPLKEGRGRGRTWLY